MLAELVRIASPSRFWPCNLISTSGGIVPAHYPFRTVASLPVGPSEVINESIKGPTCKELTGTSYVDIVPAAGANWQIVVTGINFATQINQPTIVSLRQDSDNPQWMTTVDGGDGNGGSYQSVTFEPRWILRKNVPLQGKLNIAGSVLVCVQYYIAAA